MGADARPSRPGAGAPRFRILVVEDEPRIRDIIRLYLERAGYAVTLSGDGRDALEAFDADPPDLAIIDAPTRLASTPSAWAPTTT
jgi:CheY-like chemotaxis protein